VISSIDHSRPFGGLGLGAEQIARYVLRSQYAQPETLRQAFTSFKSDAGDVIAIGAAREITQASEDLVDPHSSGLRGDAQHRDARARARSADDPSVRHGGSVNGVPFPHLPGHELSTR
jgi:hypothetical protein